MTHALTTDALDRRNAVLATLSPSALARLDECPELLRALNAVCQRAADDEWLANLQAPDAS